MLAKFDRTIHVFANRISMHEQDLCSRIDKSVHDEDDFTSRLADRIEQSLDGFLDVGYSWRVTTRKLPWRGAGSEESKIGADLHIILSVNSPEFNISKGVLVQSKLINKIEEIRTNFMPLKFKVDSRLKTQMEKMLRVTPEAFVWIYGAPGVRVVRAGTLAACRTQESVLQVENRSLGGFFTEFFRCMYGDHNLGDMKDSKNASDAFEGFGYRTLVISATSDREIVQD